MVTNLREEDRPEPWHKKKTHVPASDRETRTAGRTVPRNDAVQEKKVSKVPSGSAPKRRTSKGKGVDCAKGMKKTKLVPATTANVLLGRGENPVRSVEELNKKTEEDARACGRRRRQDCIKLWHSKILPKDNVHFYGWWGNWEEEPTDNAWSALYFSKHGSSGRSKR